MRGQDWYGAVLALGLWAGAAHGAGYDGDREELFAGGPTRAAAIEIAFGADFPHVENAKLAAWPHEADAYVVAAHATEIDPPNEVGGPIELHVAKLKRAGKALRLVARGRHRFEGMRWHNSLAFDFAPYRLRAGETAIGLRLHTSYSSTSYAANWSGLFLFRAVGNQLRPVFEGMMDRTMIEHTSTPEATGDDKKDGGTDANDNESVLAAVILIGKPGPDGFNDLLYKATEGERPAGSSEALKDAKTHTEVYRWNGQRYIQPNTKAN